jgi:hypothetical protein
MPCRILYFRGGILEATEDFAPEDLFEAARLASSTNPDLTAEIWHDGRKAAVIRPCSRHPPSHPLPPHMKRVPDEMELRVSTSPTIERDDGTRRDEESTDKPAVLGRADQLD